MHDYQSLGNNQITGLSAPARLYLHMPLLLQVTAKVSINPHNQLMQRPS